jgi:hypothetical protein
MQDFNRSDLANQSSESRENFIILKLTDEKFERRNVKERDT